MKMARWLVALALVGAVARGADAGGGIAVVDMEDLVRRHPNTAADRKALDATLKQYEGERDTQRAKLDAMRVEYENVAREADSPALSASGRKKAEDDAFKKREALVEADRQFGEMMQLRRKQLSEQEMRMLKRTTSDLREVIAKIAAQRKLAVVIGAATVAYAEKNVDITADVLRALGVDPNAPIPDDTPGAAVPAIGPVDPKGKGRDAKP
jgi:Skp family chaperone for outer membrane proteins